MLDCLISKRKLVKCGRNSQYGSRKYYEVEVFYPVSSRPDSKNPNYWFALAFAILARYSHRIKKKKESHSAIRERVSD